MGRSGLSRRRLGVALVLSTLLIVGVLGTIGWLFGMPCSITKLVRTTEGEELKAMIVVGMRPSFVEYLGWQLAWGVGGSPRSTVNIRFQVLVTGTNIASTAKVYFYIEARDSSGSPTYRELDFSSSPQTVTVGSTATYETGSMTIDTHLSHLYGSIPTADKTIDYYVWCRVEATGLISGKTLTAEVPLTKFDSIFYDYGSEATSTLTGYDAHVYKYSPNSNYGSSDYIYVGGSLTYRYWGYLKVQSAVSFSSDDVVDAKLKLYVYNTGDEIYVYTTGDFSESSITWNNKPDPITYLGSFTPSATGWVEFTSSEFVDSVKSAISDGSIHLCLCLKPYTDTADTDKAYFYSREKDSSKSFRIEVTYVDWSASWSWINLDTLSITALQVVQDVLSIVAMLLSIVVSYLTIKILRRRVK